MISKLVRRNIAATKGRLILMLLSIVLGVSFVSGSFLLADSLRAVFGDIAATIYQGVDAQVRATETELSSGNQLARFDESVFADLDALDEVAYAEPIIGVFEGVYTIGDDGEANRPQGPPTFGSSWAGPSPVSSFNLIDGRAPVGNEIAIDIAQARDHDLVLGQIVSVGGGGGGGTTEAVDMEVVGIVSFGELTGGVSAYFNLFDLATLQGLLGAEGRIDAVSISAVDGVSSEDLIAATSGTITDSRLEVVPGTVLVDEQNEEFNEFIDIFGYVLLGFAIVVLFVSIFIIYNTFAILIGQRIRQFGLLRSVGATGGQLTTMVMIEALLIGIIASIIGLFGGAAVATFLKWLFSQGGGEFPDGPLLFKPRTIIIVFVLGVGVTLGSALLPAWVAQRIPPLAALRDGAAATTTSRSKRVLRGGVLFGAGVALLLAGLFGSLDTTPRLAALGVGSALTFIGVALLSVLFASTVTRIIGAPVEQAFGLTGRLGRDNASRNPQRTAATATALMIGLALITGVLVLTQSLQATFDKILDETVAADVFIYESVGNAFPDTAAEQLKLAPEIGDVAAISNTVAFLDGATSSVGVSGFDLESGDRVLDIDLIAGSYDAGADGVLVLDTHAEENGFQLGDTVTAQFDDGGPISTFDIVGLFGNNTFFNDGGNNWVFDRSVIAETEDTLVDFIGATFAPGADPGDAELAAKDAVFSYLTVENNADFKASREAQLNQVLYLILGLLGLCIVVAFIGIVNTMALSILERTREIGLLRAIGTSRRQLRKMVRWEAIIVGLFGAGLGVLLGLVIGYAAVTAIPDSFISEIAIPWKFAIAFMIVGGLLGMLAAVFPARRAARMNVLDAISTI